jgi:hypothetical protein
MNYLNNYLLGGLSRNLSLLDWQILEKELASIDRISTTLSETIQRTPNKQR